MPAMTDYMTRLLRRTKAGILQLFGQAAKKEATSPDVKFVSELNMDIEMRQLQMEQEQEQKQQRHEIELEMELNRGGVTRMSTDNNNNNNNNNENENSNHNSSSSDDEVEYYCYNQQYSNRSTRVVDLTQKTLRPPVGFYCK